MDVRNLPAICTVNESTSPITNNFVSQRFLIRDCFSPSINSMILPNTMYMLAAYKAGARSNRSDCMMNGPSVQFGDSLLESTLPMYPTTWTVG